MSKAEVVLVSTTEESCCCERSCTKAVNKNLHYPAMGPSAALNRRRKDISQWPKGVSDSIAVYFLPALQHWLMPAVFNPLAHTCTRIAAGSGIPKLHSCAALYHVRAAMFWRSDTLPGCP